MSRRFEKTADLLRAHGLAVGFGAVLLVCGVLAVRWVVKNREAPPPRKAGPQFTVVNLQPPPPPRTPPPPPPPDVKPPKPVEEPENERVQLKATDVPPPDAPPPAAAPAAGPLALAAEGTGPGDAFNLAGNPGGRGILTGGGIGDGAGAGSGLGGEYDPMARYGWYYGKVASRLQEAFQRNKLLANAALQVEVRVWEDGSGRITRVELVRSTGDPRYDAAIRADAVGVRLSQAPPADVPMPMILRITIRRPQ